MAFAVITFDRPGSQAIRDQYRASHIAYLDSYKSKLLASGGTTTEEGQFNGGVIIIDVEDRIEADRFATEDPFAKAGLFENTIITRWRKAFFNFERMF